MPRRRRSHTSNHTEQGSIVERNTGKKSLTVPEVAQRLGVCPRTVRTLVNAGDLPCIDVAPASSTRRSLRFMLEDVLDFQARRAVAPAAGAPRKARGYVCQHL